MQIHCTFTVHTLYGNPILHVCEPPSAHSYPALVTTLCRVYDNTNGFLLQGKVDCSVVLLNDMLMIFRFD